MTADVNRRFIVSSPVFACLSVCLSVCSPAAAFSWLGAVATYSLKDAMERRRPASRRLRRGVQVGCFLHLFVVRHSTSIR